MRTLLFAAAITAVLPTAAIAEPMPCSMLGKIKSLNHDHPIDVTFRNRSGERRVLVWMNYEGKAVITSTLEPGQVVGQHTFLTHPWAIFNDTGRCLWIETPPGPGTVTIGETPKF